MKHVLLLFAITSVLAFASSCSSSKSASESETSRTEPEPDWVKRRPMDNHYYIGIAVVDKRQYPNTYAEEARKLAISELASEIEVDIKTASMLFTFENGEGEFRDEYRSYSRVNTNKSLRNFELEDIYETDRKYYVYYRLSKERYKRDKTERMNRAIDESKTHADVARGHKENKRYRDAFVSYMAAVQSIEAFAGEPLRTEVEGSEVFWGNHLLAEINRFAKSLRINSGPASYNVKWGLEPPEEAVSFVLRDAQKNSIPGIPVRFEYSEGFIRPRLSLTDLRGNVTANLTKIRDKKEQQELKARVDLVEMFNSAGEQQADAFMEDLILQITAPETEKILNVRPPAVYVNYAANLPRGTSGTDDIMSAAKDRLNSLGFTIAPNPAQSDLQLTISVDVKLLESMSDMHRCDLTGKMEVILTDKKENLYSESFPSIRGVQLSDGAAVQNAIYKAADETDATLIPRFHRYLLR